VRLKTGDTERDLTSSRYCNVVVVDTSPETNMADVREREKIAREKTNELIGKKHCALKTDKIEEDMIIEQTF